MLSEDFLRVLAASTEVFDTDDPEMAREILRLRPLARVDSVVERMVPKLVAAARRLIVENEAVARDAWGPGAGWRDRWERHDTENFEAVAGLRTWCDAIDEAAKEQP